MYDEEDERPQLKHLISLVNEIDVDEDSDHQFAELLYTASENGWIENTSTEDAYRIIKLFELSRNIGTIDLKKVRM